MWICGLCVRFTCSTAWNVPATDSPLKFRIWRKVLMHDVKFRKFLKLIIIKFDLIFMAHQSRQKRIWILRASGDISWIWKSWHDHVKRTLQFCVCTSARRAAESRAEFVLRSLGPIFTNTSRTTWSGLRVKNSRCQQHKTKKDKLFLCEQNNGSAQGEPNALKKLVGRMPFCFA